jgi:general secretion pathway protein A
MAPDPAIFFESRTHSEALGSLAAFLEQRAGLALIYGHEGAGKTVVCKRFLGNVDENRFDVLLMAEPPGEIVSFLSDIARHFGVPFAPQSSADEMAEELVETLCRSRERRPVLAIDNADLLSDDAIDFMERLYRGEMPEPPASFMVILFGREELVMRLLERRMRPIRRHIVMTHFLQPLNAEEVAAYIRHRLLNAGSHGLIRFDEKVVEMLHAASGGSPAMINSICERCLAVLYEQSKTVVDGRVLQEALTKGDGGLLPGRAARTRSRKRLYITGGLVIAAVIALLCLLFLRFRPALGL